MSDEKTHSDLHQAAAELGAAGGKVGGPARARKLSAEDRSRIARKAAAARWSKASRRGEKKSQEQTPTKQVGKKIGRKRKTKKG